jgi:bifunctional non-homologous end joining protein LigD
MRNAMPQTIKPMKATLEDHAPGTDWHSEVKWDGYRAIAYCDGSLRLQGKRLNDITADFPELEGLGRSRAAVGTVLDGELVVLDDQGRPDFQLMQSRRERGLTVSFVIFDLLWEGGEDLRPLPYEVRRERLEALDPKGDSWFTPERLDGTPEESLAATEALGLEGVVLKRPGSPYVEGSRSRHWLKLKNVRRQEFVIGGWLPGKGHRAGTFGALLLGYHDEDGSLRYAGRAGTGFDDRLLREIHASLETIGSDTSPFVAGDVDSIPRDATWVEPRLVAEVRFTQWTRDGRLRNPAFLGLRPDSDPVRVVREEPA